MSVPVSCVATQLQVDARPGPGGESESQRFLILHVCYSTLAFKGHCTRSSHSFAHNALQHQAGQACCVTVNFYAPLYPTLVMSGLNLNTITENATRLGARLQETISEHTRDLSITRGGSAVYFDTPEEKLKQIRKQLDSSSDREKLDAMKRLIAVRCAEGFWSLE